MYRPTITEEIKAESMARAVEATFLPVSKATDAFELLEEVIEIILAEPRRYNQGVWVAGMNELMHRREMELEVPNCGTMGCIAGWIDLIKGVRPRWRAEAIEVGDRAARILGFKMRMGWQYGDAVALHEETGEWLDTEEKRRWDEEFNREVRPINELFDDTMYRWATDEEREKNLHTVPGTPEYAAIGVRKIRMFMYEHEARLKAKAV